MRKDTADETCRTARRAGRQGDDDDDDDEDEEDEEDEKLNRGRGELESGGFPPTPPLFSSRLGFGRDSKRAKDTKEGREGEPRRRAGLPDVHRNDEDEDHHR